jgi:hypothetical protein
MKTMVGPRTKVRVEVRGRVVPEWHVRCIVALRALDGVDVSVRAGDRPYRAPRGPAALLAGPALAPAAVEPSGDPHGDVDLVVDLTGAADTGAAETLRFRAGEDDDPCWPFAREIMRGSAVAEVALVRRTNGCQTVLRSGRFRVTRWYGGTLRWALFVAATWPAVIVAARRAGAHLHESEARPAAVHRPLGPVESLRFAGSLLARIVGYLGPRMFERAQWNVGFVDAEPRALVAGEALAPRWLPEPRKRTFVADPFVMTHAGRRVVFVEQYDDLRARGVIEAIELDANDAVVERRVVLDLPTHVSYPYALELDGAPYLIPENAAGGEVALYRCVEFPWRWERETALFADFDGLDTTLFPHDGRWWAFCTRASRGSDFALHAYYADSPRATAWQPHPLNPIVEDITCGRPAGSVFAVDGVLYRPGQDCSASYGGGLWIVRIDELSPQGYRETVVRRVDTRGFGRFGDGVHTVGTTRTGLVFDGKRVTLDPLKPLDTLRLACMRALSASRSNGSSRRDRSRSPARS